MIPPFTNEHKRMYSIMRKESCTRRKPWCGLEALVCSEPLNDSDHRDKLETNGKRSSRAASFSLRIFPDQFLNSAAARASESPLRGWLDSLCCGDLWRPVRAQMSLSSGGQSRRGPCNLDSSRPPGICKTWKLQWGLDQEDTQEDT